ncbi:hypothetical protein WA538_004183 [Blastocystis sp. DL]
MSTIKRKAALKVIVLGDSSVGKSCIIQQYVFKKFSDKYKSTIGADFFSHDVVIDDVPYTLQIWDTAGQERFQSLGSSFYRGTDACLLAFDLTNARSFKDLEKWQDDFLVAASPSDPLNFPFVVVGNKVDLPESERKVTKEEVEQWSTSRRVTGMHYYETSAKENIGIEDAFMDALKQAIAQKTEEEEYVPEVIDLNDVKPATTQKCNC